MPERCHACQQPLLHGTMAGRAVWGCANCNVFAAEDGTGPYFALDAAGLREIARQRPPGEGFGA